MKQNETIVRVLYRDTDQMGVVYYANYLVWFEVGRTEFLRELGISYKVLEQNDLLLPVIETYCKYKQPARYDDELKIITRLDSLKEVKIGFYYQVFHLERGDLLAYGETVHAFLNKKGKPIALKKHNPFLWKILMGQFQERDEIR